MATSERECIGALWEAADRLDKSPTKAEYEDLGLTPASATIVRVVGGWNEAKERAGLEVNPSTGSRTKPKPDHVKLPEGADWEELSVDQRWYYRYPGRSYEWDVQRRARLRSWVNDRKRARGCSRCGIDDPACLEFHHEDDDRKELGVGKMVNRMYAKDRITEEMRKCEVLCTNCHRKRHYGRSVDDPGRATGEESEAATSLESMTGRAWLHEYKRRTDGCTRCDEDDPICLDFHHVEDEKLDSVSKLVTYDRPKDVVRTEIDRCEVLCANCHRKEHNESPEIS